MSRASKAELIRRQLVREAKEEDFERSFVRQIISVAKEMGGWKIEDILDMSMLRYNEVREALQFAHEQDRKTMEAPKRKLTLG